MEATVYQQIEPIMIRTLRNGDEIHTEYGANLVVLGTVSGSKAECWNQSYALTKYPVLEFSVPYQGVIE